jgi:hypothetical protein
MIGKTMSRKPLKRDRLNPLSNLGTFLAVPNLGTFLAVPNLGTYRDE